MLINIRRIWQLMLSATECQTSERRSASDSCRLFDRIEISLMFRFGRTNPNGGNDRPKHSAGLFTRAHFIV